MKIPVFLSYPKPFLAKQEDFLKKTFEYLDNRGLAARTLGVTDYDMDAPLKAVRRILAAQPTFHSGRGLIAAQRDFCKALSVSASHIGR